MILLVTAFRGEADEDTRGEGEDSMQLSKLSLFLVNFRDGGVERFVSKRLCARLVTGLRRSSLLNGIKM